MAAPIAPVAPKATNPVNSAGNSQSPATPEATPAGLGPSLKIERVTPPTINLPDPKAVAVGTKGEAELQANVPPLEQLQDLAKGTGSPDTKGKTSEPAKTEIKDRERQQFERARQAVGKIVDSTTDFQANDKVFTEQSRKEATRIASFEGSNAQREIAAAATDARVSFGSKIAEIEAESAKLSQSSGKTEILGLLEKAEKAQTTAERNEVLQEAGRKLTQVEARIREDRKNQGDKRNDLHRRAQVADDQARAIHSKPPTPGEAVQPGTKVAEFQSATADAERNIFIANNVAREADLQRLGMNASELSLFKQIQAELEGVITVADAKVTEQQAQEGQEQAKTAEDKQQDAAGGSESENTANTAQTPEQQLAELYQKVTEDLNLVVRTRFPGAPPELTSQLQAVLNNANPEDLVKFHRIIERRFSQQEGRLLLSPDGRVAEFLGRVSEQLPRKLRRQGMSDEVIARDVAAKQLAVLAANNNELRVLGREFPRFPLLSLLWKFLGLLGFTVTMDLAKQVFPSVGKML